MSEDAELLPSRPRRRACLRARGYAPDGGSLTNLRCLPLRLFGPRRNHGKLKVETVDIRNKLSAISRRTGSTSATGSGNEKKEKKSHLKLTLMIYMSSHELMRVHQESVALYRAQYLQ